MDMLNTLVAAVPLSQEEAAAWRLGQPQHLRLESIRWANLTDAAQRSLEPDHVRVLLWVDSRCRWYWLDDMPGDQVLDQCAKLGWTFELEPGHAWPLTHVTHAARRGRLP